MNSASATISLVKDTRASSAVEMASATAVSANAIRAGQVTIVPVRIPRTPASPPMETI